MEGKKYICKGPRVRKGIMLLWSYRRFVTGSSQNIRAKETGLDLMDLLRNLNFNQRTVGNHYMAVEEGNDNI